MMTNADLKYHFHPAKGWLNDPNGLCRFGDSYHLFFQHETGSEVPWAEPMVWGHARTKDFLTFEELPVALRNDMPYDDHGVWSGTAAEKDGVLYLFYASVTDGMRQTVSVATSEDGIRFRKYEGNPVISEYPVDCAGNFRDPAILIGKDEHYLVIASADVEKKTGTLLLYTSPDLFHWTYSGVLYEYEDCRFCECPSFVPAEDGGYLLSCSVVRNDGSHYFEVLYGAFDGKRFTPSVVSHFQKGPHEYAGQIFHDPKGRNIMMSWVSGWDFHPPKCIGCLSMPLEIRLTDGKIKAYPIEEVRHLVAPDDTLTDAYVKETYLNGGEEVRIELLELPVNEQ